MKQHTLKEGKLFIGTAREILSLYRNYRERELADYVFTSYPKMNMSRNYGLLITTLVYVIPCMIMRIYY